MSKDTLSFELRADAEDFSGGSVSLPDGKSFDVGKALSNGQISTDDPVVADALRRHPALKQVSAKSASPQKKEDS